MQIIYFSLIAGLIPLIGFALTYKKQGLDKGVWFGCGLAVIELVIVYFWLGVVDYTVVFAIGLFLALGIMSVKSKNELFFKMQPAIMFFAMALLVAYHQLFDQPIFLKYFERYRSQLPAEILNQFNSIPNHETLFTNQSLALGVGLFICSLIMFYVAKKLSVKWWLICRAFVFYVVCFPLSILASIVSLSVGVS